MRRLLIPVLCAAAVAIMAPGAHAAAPVRCGQTITGSVVLDRDLHCSGGGLTMAPGASLDLGGHALIGSKRGTGITLPDNGDATISNGTIRYWANAVRPAGQYSDHTGTTTVSRLVVTNNDRGIVTLTYNVEGGPVLNIADSTFVDNVVAIRTRTTRVTMRDSYVKVTTPSDGTTHVVGVDNSYSNVLIYHSIFQGVPIGVECGEGPCHITTTVFRDGKVGVVAGGYNPGSDVKLWANRFTRLDIGVSTGPSTATVRIAHNRFLQARIGVSARNVPLELIGNDMRQGVAGLRLADDPVPSDPMVGTIANNTVSGYTDDGLVVRAPAARASEIGVGDNAVDDNADFGINAPGVTDLGGNTASGNGHDPQCVGVVCT